MDGKYPYLNFRVVLVEPEIPTNTGNIGRTCVGTFCELHLVGKLGFEISDRQLKRAGLDYWQHLRVFHHPDWEAWWRHVSDPERVFFFSKKAERDYWQANFQPGDWLVFGKETKGLDENILKRFPGQTLRIPSPGPIRSLNLASAVSVAVFEGLRQIGNPPGQGGG